MPKSTVARPGPEHGSLVPESKVLTIRPPRPSKGQILRNREFSDNTWFTLHQRNRRCGFVICCHVYVYLNLLAVSCSYLPVKYILFCPLFSSFPFSLLPLFFYFEFTSSLYPFLCLLFLTYLHVYVFRSE